MRVALAALARNVVKRAVEMCDFIECPAIKEAIEQRIVPVSMPRTVEAVVDISVWVGLGTVGLWAALDAFAERANLKSNCSTCKRSLCIWARFKHINLSNEESRRLEELEDLRHLYAHNYAGEADDKYFEYERHVLQPDAPAQLTCGAQFDGRRLSLNLLHLRKYASTVQSVLARFP